MDGNQSRALLRPGPIGWREALVCGALTFCVYAAGIPRFVSYSSPPTGDQPFYLMDVASLVQDGDLDVKNNYDASDFDRFYSKAPHPPGFEGMHAPYPLPRQLAPSSARPSSEQYSFHLPGLAVYLAPFWALGSSLELWWPATLVGMCLAGSLAAANALLLGAEASGRRWAAWLAWLALAFGSPMMPHAYVVFSELPCGLLLIYAFRRLALGWSANGCGRLFWIGCAIGALPWLAWRCVLISGGLCAFAMLQAWREARHGRGSAPSPRKGLHPLTRGFARSLAFWAPILGSAAGIVRYSLFLFGAWLPVTSVPEATVNPFTWPWSGFASLIQFLRHAWGLLFDGTFGLLPYSPVLALAGLGLIPLLRRRGEAPDLRLALAGLLVCGPYLGMITGFIFWSGIWCFPARYLTTFAPLLAAPLALALASASPGWPRRLLVGLFVALLGAGLGMMLVFWADPRLFWPLVPQRAFAWLGGSLARWIPSFEQPDPVLLMRTTAGWGLGLFCCLGLGQLALPARLRLRWPAWLLLGSTFAGSWGIVHFPELGHHIELEELRSWDLGGRVQDPRGMLFVDGKLWIASYYGASVLVFDPDTGQLYRLRPFDAAGDLSWAHPADLELGPDGLVYVLNNGLGRDAVWALSRKGELLRRLELRGATPVCLGLSLASDGGIYVADTLAGSILHYSREGGEPLSIFRGESGSSLNNPIDAFVDARGVVSAVDLMPRLLQFDSRGRVTREFTPPCRAGYFAGSAQDADWLEVAGDCGVLSLDLGRGALTRCRVGFKRWRSEPFSGLTRGAGFVLYGLRGSQLIEYQIRR